MLNHVDHGGAGPDLVLLHAFPLSSRMWRRLVPLATDRWRVVTVDLPGLGASPVPASVPSMTAVADGVRDVLDHLGIETATVFGVSTGGYAALALAGLFPKRVAALALGSTTTRVIAPDDPDERRRTAVEVERSGSTDAVAGSADEGLGATAHRDQPGLRDELISVLARADPAGVAWMARAIAAREDTASTLRAFTGRVLLVFGAEDEATPPERGEEMLRLRADEDTTYIVLPAVGHLTALEAPGAVAECLERLRV
ncbi:alpha/beta hydrolase [Marmoricola endophyticus]|uniref:Alpha/beta hydrolase n=1 Tax=Marmoricola endophyticus TaxID=2040280 RepID=A0A917BMM7_9ACTN|nr:alpha/beta hydrolase [Marmoricola endophyticus]GGF50776.1 alpha/beta hydrolase [Marmoricola endophyticus]